jgi:hypothetical protein
MPRVEFKPTTPVFERAKTFHALDRAATGIGTILHIPYTNLKQQNCKPKSPRYAVFSIPVLVHPSQV